MKKWLPLVLLLAVAAALFAAFPALTYECDAVIYSSDALRGATDALWYPGHLGFVPLVITASKLARAAEPPRDPIPFLQVAAALGALLGLAAFQRALVRLGAGEARAAVFAGLLGASYGYWHYATQGESHVLSSAALVLYMLAFLRVIESPRAGRVMLAAAALALATLMHQKNLLLVLTALAGGFAAVRDPKRTLALALPFAAVYALLAITPYFAIGAGLLGHHDYASFRHWLRGLSEWAPWGKWERTTPAKAVVGLVRSWVGSHFVLGFGPVLAFAKKLFPGSSLEDEVAAAASIPVLARLPLVLVAVGVLASTGAWLAARAGRVVNAARSLDAVTVFLLTWIAVVGGFATWWAPERAEFWMDLFPPVLALLAVRGAPAGGAVRWKLAALLLAGLALVNLVGSIRPQALPDADRETRLAMTISAAMPQGSAVMADVPFRGRGSIYALAFEKVDLLAAGERAPEVADSVLALRGGRPTFLLVTPMREDPAKNAAWRETVARLGERFRLGPPVPMRHGAELRPIARAAD